MVMPSLVRSSLLALPFFIGLGCESGGRGSGSTAKEGGTCKQSQQQSDVKVCDTTRSMALECKETDVAGTYAWKQDKDCAAQGLTCSNGACVAQTSTDTSGGSTGSDTSGGSTGSDTSGGSSGGACSDLSGTWSFDSHCDSQYVGSSVTVSQSGCQFSFTGGGISNASGTISGTTSITVSGTSSAGIVSCNGTVEMKSGAAHQVDLSCSPTCDLKLKRSTAVDP
jgi:hypothetical protein